MQSTIGSLSIIPTCLLSLPDVAMSLFYSFDYLSSDLVSDCSDSLAGTWLSKNISDFIAKLPEENIYIIQILLSLCFRDYPKLSVLNYGG
jgi:hypothetical protein